MIEKVEIMTAYQFIIISSVLGGVLAGMVMIYNVLNDILIILIHKKDNGDAWETKE